MAPSKTLTIESVNPANKEILGEFPVMDENQVKESVENAWKAFEDWQLLDYGKRARYILKLRRVIANQAEELAELISKEVGKPISEAYASELNGTLDTCVWLADNAERILKDQTHYFRFKKLDKIQRK